MPVRILFQFTMGFLLAASTSYGETIGEVSSGISSPTSTSSGEISEACAKSCDCRFKWYQCESLKEKGDPNVINCSTYKEDVLQLAKRPTWAALGVADAAIYRPIKFLFYDLPESQMKTAEREACRTDAEKKKKMLDPIIDGLERPMLDIITKGWTCDAVLNFVTQRQEMMWRVLNTKTKPSDEWGDSVESHYHDLTEHERMFLAKNAAFTPPQLKAFARQFISRYHTAYQCYRPDEAWKMTAAMLTDGVMLAASPFAISKLAKARQLQDLSELGVIADVKPSQLTTTATRAANGTNEAKDLSPLTKQVEGLEKDLQKKVHCNLSQNVCFGASDKFREMLQKRLGLKTDMTETSYGGFEHWILTVKDYFGKGKDLIIDPTIQQFVPNASRTGSKIFIGSEDDLRAYAIRNKMDLNDIEQYIRRDTLGARPWFPEWNEQRLREINSGSP